MAEEARPDAFRFLNSISFTKENLQDDPRFAQDYSTYFTNLMLSYHPDVLWQVYLMAKHPEIPAMYQYLYYLNTVRKRRRFTKLHKVPKNADVALIQQYFGYNIKKAKEALAVLSEDAVKAIRKKSNMGGPAKE